jgi:hypothetical protein
MRNGHRRLLRATLSSLFAAVLLSWPPALAQFKQDGNMLVSSCDGLGGGGSVALSGDGTTAIVMGDNVTPLSISAYVYTVAPVTWIQQGCGLPATGFPAARGAVAVSADGNTVIQGAPTQPGSNGNSVAWVFTRSGETWNPVLLVGNAFGGAIALSADGNTVIVADWLDSTSNGAAWVFTRSGGVWSQQGGKLVGSGALGAAGQGFSVALSGDGNTAILGGLNDNNQVGAAWVFTRSDGVWTQQAKLVGNDAVANPFVHQGYSVALSGDGNTAIVGGRDDNNGAGAVWVFTRSGGQWTQQGSKLVGSGAVGKSGQGSSVALSGDGNLAIVGGPFDNGAPSAMRSARPGFSPGAAALGPSCKSWPTTVKETFRRPSSAQALHCRQMDARPSSVRPAWSTAGRSCSSRRADGPPIPTTSTATARATFSGATPAGMWRRG